MFEKKEKNFVVESYDNLLREKTRIANQLANTQRKKDLEVDKINRKYEGTIESLLRKQSANSMQIELAKRYTKDN